MLIPYFILMGLSYWYAMLAHGRAKWIYYTASALAGLNIILMVIR